MTNKDDLMRSGPTKRDGESLEEVELYHRKWRGEHHHKGCRCTSNLQKPENHKLKKTQSQEEVLHKNSIISSSLQYSKKQEQHMTLIHYYFTISEVDR